MVLAECPLRLRWDDVEIHQAASSTPRRPWRNTPTIFVERAKKAINLLSCAIWMFVMREVTRIQKRFEIKIGKEFAEPIRPLDVESPVTLCPSNAGRHGDRGKRSAALRLFGSLRSCRPVPGRASLDIAGPPEILNQASQSFFIKRLRVMCPKLDEVAQKDLRRLRRTAQQGAAISL